ncbi:M15 family metallopeptidase [Paenibacillus sp. DR312]|uniref:M15 family metallopeptidase n=1 Tax=unclassified Paenibacillus TaxID=185978 RepID=UPI001C96A1AC|nr:M15 family metallopeptidase [Paenibacillus sp. DR312]QZN77387.1 M15 family metallopeptidase [Paenibacillus sp. DR312]
MTLTLDYVMSKSAAKLTGLLPVVRTATERLIQRSFAIGIPIVITQGLRTVAEQDALYAQGRSKPGKVVTNARGGYSYHNFGVAVDYVLLMPDGKSVSWDTVRDGNGDKRADWLQVAEIGKGLGFIWGGDWASFPDYPHLQMDFGLSTAQCRAGQRPTQMQINVAMAKLQIKEDKPVTQERDINVPSKWAEAAWAEVTANGYFDGTRPGAMITREESAIVTNRLRKNILKLIAGINGNVSDMDDRLKKIEAEG